MKKDTHKTKVIFKMMKGEVVAFFPEIAGTNDPYTCSCYAHIGQHSSADAWLASGLLHAKEFAELKKELERIGYSLCVGRKFTQAALEKRREMCK